MGPLEQIAKQPPSKKSISEIINHHISHNKLDTHHDEVATAMASAVKQGFQMIQFGNVIFATKPQDDGVLFSMINGESPIGYIKAFKKFVKYFQNKGINKFLIYVHDQDSAKKIANSAGLKNITFEESNKGGIDPYLMTAEA